MLWLISSSLSPFSSMINPKYMNFLALDMVPHYNNGALAPRVGVVPKLEKPAPIIVVMGMKN